jgi:hypothetical protein
MSSGKLVYNPLEDIFEFSGGNATSAEDSERIVLPDITVDSGISIGDWVREDFGSPNSALSIPNNSITTLPAGVWGLVIDKPTSTTADVLVLGKTSGFSGLTAGELYINTDGTATQSAPSTGIYQPLARALSSNTIFVQIKDFVIRKT